MNNIKNIFLTASMLMSTAITVSMEQLPQPPQQTALEKLPADITREILNASMQVPTKYGAVINIPTLSKTIRALGSTSKKLRANIYTPQNIIALFKALPTNSAVSYLAAQLKDTPGMKSIEVQHYLEQIKLESGKKLYEGVLVNNIETVTDILSNSIDLDWHDDQRVDDQQTSLIHASKSGYSIIVKLLLLAGANPNVQYYARRTALFEAVHFGSNEIIELLLAAGAKPNLQTVISPLFIVISKGNMEAAKLLLAAGANPEDDDFIREKCDKDILELLDAASAARKQ